MPASRARTAICSAPFECPSSPGLPTRILTRRPSDSDTRSTFSRSSVKLSESAAAAAPLLDRADAVPLHVRVDRQDPAVLALGEGRLLGRGVDVLADHLQIAR